MSLNNSHYFMALLNYGVCAFITTNETTIEIYLYSICAICSDSKWDWAQSNRAIALISIRVCCDVKASISFRRTTSMTIIREFSGLISSQQYLHVSDFDATLFEIKCHYFSFSILDCYLCLFRFQRTRRMYKRSIVLLAHSNEVRVQMDCH